MSAFYDDPRPVDAEFFEAAGIPDSVRTRNGKRFELRASVRVLAFACPGPECWRFELWIGNETFCKGPTRGHIRRLCRELRVPLADEPKEEAATIEEPKGNPDVGHSLEGITIIGRPKTEPDIPAIFGVIADFANANRMTIEAAIDTVNHARQVEPLEAAEIKLKIVEHWQTVAARYPFMPPTKMEIERLRNELRALQRRREVVQVVAEFFR